MEWLGLVGPIAGLLGLTVAVINALTSKRGQDHQERVEDERLGHADLVDALEAQRHQIADLRLELAETRAEADHWKAVAREAQDKVTDLLFLLETRRDKP